MTLIIKTIAWPIMALDLIQIGKAWGATLNFKLQECPVPRQSLSVNQLCTSHFIVVGYVHQLPFPTQTHHTCSTRLRTLRVTPLPLLPPSLLSLMVLRVDDDDDKKSSADGMGDDLSSIVKVRMKQNPSGSPDTYRQDHLKSTLQQVVKKCTIYCKSTTRVLDMSVETDSLLGL